MRFLKKGKDSFCEKVLEKEWNKCKIPGRKRKQWKNCVLDIISDMDLTSTSLGSKEEAVSSINNAFKNFVISSLHSGMRVYIELKEDFERKKYLHGVSDTGSKLLFRFRSGTHGLNEELGRHNTRNSSKACLFCECECESVEHVLWECSEYRSICKEFITNLDGFLQNDFHLKSSFDKTKYIFDQSIWECNGHFDHWFFKILRLFLCNIWNLRREKLYPSSGSCILVLHSSINRCVVNGRNAMVAHS